MSLSWGAGTRDESAWLQRRSHKRREVRKHVDKYFSTCWAVTAVDVMEVFFLLVLLYKGNGKTARAKKITRGFCKFQRNKAISSFSNGILLSSGCLCLRKSEPNHVIFRMIRAMVEKFNQKTCKMEVISFTAPILSAYPTFPQNTCTPSSTTSTQPHSCTITIQHRNPCSVPNVYCLQSYVRCLMFVRSNLLYLH